MEAAKGLVPSEYTQPCPNDVAPVPPFATVSAALSESEPIVTVPKDALCEKRLVEDAMEEKSVVEVALVEVLLMMSRLVIVLDAELTRMPSPAASGERYAPASVQLDPPPVGHVVRQMSPVKQMVVAPKVVVVALVPTMVEAKSVVDVAFVDCRVVAKSDVEVAFVVVPLVPRKLVTTPLVAESAVAKSEVVVAFEVVALRAVKFCKVEEESTRRFGVVNNAPLNNERLPLASTESAVVVAKPAVDVERAKRFVVPPAAPATESFAHGDVVPMPTLPCIIAPFVGAAML